MPLLFLLTLFISPILAAETWDPYEALLALADRDQQPRLLNTEDVAGLRPNDPQELLTPQGDFNLDGSSDVAMMGVYDLPKTPKRYFLLVASRDKDGKIWPLYQKELSQPLFLHSPGTTGPGDPKTQAFSYTRCWECDNGVDVFWNAKKKTFLEKAWEKRTAVSSPPPTPLPDVPQETIEAALHLVGVLPDVRTYVDAVKKKNGRLGTRVAWESMVNNRVWVEIYEKTEGGEIIFDRLLVGTNERKILKRQLSTSGSK